MFHNVFYSKMIKIIAILLLILCLVDAILGKSYIINLINTRTASLDVSDGLKLNFSVRWGLNMHQTISLSRYFYVFAKEEEEVYRKPHWAGGPLYADKNKSHYYMVVRSGPCTQECYIFFIIDVANRNIAVSCDLDKNVSSNIDYIGQFNITPDWFFSFRGGGVSFTPAGQTPSGFKFEADTTQFKRWCDD